MGNNKDVYAGITLDIVTYLREHEGWSVEYSKEVVLEQISKMAREMYTQLEGGTIEQKMASVEYFRNAARKEDYLALVDRLVALISKYKKPKDVKEMERKLKLIVNKYF